MSAEFGQILLLCALLTALLQTIIPLWGAYVANDAWMKVARPAAFAQLLLMAAAFAVLTGLFVTQDFSVTYVVNNSNSVLPMVYRFSAVWAAHEGSLLLWALVLGVWTGAVALGTRTLPLSLQARMLAVLGMVSVGFLSFLVFTSNPFERLNPSPLEGKDLNPLLQDPGLIIHPPVLYFGYVGFSVPFAFAIAVMLEGCTEQGWLRWVRPWTNAAWGFLTVGIALGSWWAYYELGWGGWWFWDPVENASFMPWLVGTALIHSQAVTEKRGIFGSWSLLLAIATFALSMLGTFLVRSGVLTSVHSFAADPARGLFILIFLALLVGGSLLLYALRAGRLQLDANDPRRDFTPLSRETLLLANNLLLGSACAMVLLGTLYPLLADAFGLGKVSVGPPYFGSLFLVLMAPAILLLPFGPLVRWQRDQTNTATALAVPWLLLALALGLLAWWRAPQNEWKAGIGLAATAWVVLGTARFTWQHLGAGRQMSAEMMGMVLGHCGVGVFLAGALLVEALSVQHEVALEPSKQVSVGQYRVRFIGVTHREGPNYVADQAELRVFDGERELGVLRPERRLYAAGGQVMTEAGIDARFAGDTYATLGDSLGDGAWAIRVHIKPFVRLIWLGALMIAAGGFITAADRRFRADATNSQRPRSRRPS
ncbi:heme lyase CcmF/NrfE family subunit [Stenotrophomonas sp. B1-1]|uniref:heme lyase CcmF/NrfE family subunit n=1 Tax=Stenotrophomonas sp. B1-1 TaxID=2710648 RepID=UPI0013DB0DDD|nr:heme lyase CcmF/NrfE family subunit [Stenotrophomonas sp. B1-1]